MTGRRSISIHNLKVASRQRVKALPFGLFSSWRQTGLVLVWLGLLGLAMVLGFAAPEASAQSAAPDFKVQTLFDGNYRDANWVTLEISVRTRSEPWRGEVRATLPYGPGNNYAYSRAVDLAAQTESRFFFYFLPTRYEPSYEIGLFNATGQQVRQQTIKLQLNTRWDYVIGVLTEPTEVNASTLPHPGVIKIRQNDTRTIFVPLSPAQLPDRSDAFNSLNAIVLGKLDQARLTAAQWRTIMGWVEEGGKLWLSGGANFSGLSSSLNPALVAAQSQGTMQLSRVSGHYLPETLLSTLQMPEGQTLPLQKLMPQPGSLVTVVQQGGPADGLPLVVGRALGQGSVIATAFDLTSGPLTEPGDASTALWGSVAETALYGPEHLFLRQDLFVLNQMSKVIAARPPFELPNPPWMLAGLLMYGLVVAGGGYLVACKLDKPMLALVATPALALVCGAILWQIGLREAAGEVNLTRAAIASFYEDGAPVGVRTFGVSSGAVSQYTLELNRQPQPGNGWLQRPQILVLGDPRLQASPPQLFVQGPQSSAGQVQSVLSPTGKFQGFGGQGTLEGRLAIASNLAVWPDGKGLSGTVQNNSSWNLSGITLVLGENYFYLGDLSSGEQRSVNFALERLPGFLPAQNIKPDLYGANVANSDVIPTSSTLDQWQRNLQWATLNSAYLNGRFAERYQNYNLYFTGWLEGQSATALIGEMTIAEGRKLREDDFALLIKPLPFSYQPTTKTSTRFIPAAALSPIRLASQDITPEVDGSLSFAADSSTLLQYRLPAQLKLRPTRLSLLVKSERSNFSGVPASPQLEIYNWQKQTWEVLANQGDGRNRLDLANSSVASYIDPLGGFVKLKVSTKDEAYNLQQLNLEIEGEQ